MEGKELVKNFEHIGPSAPRCGWGAARGRSERLVLMLQKSEKRDVASDCPASQARIIHGKA